jgi:aminoglycoside 6'-N-acetyltransferase
MGGCPRADGADGLSISATTSTEPEPLAILAVMPSAPPVLTSARLVLRPIEEADLTVLADILVQPGVARWWGPFDLDRVRAELFEDEAVIVWTIVQGDRVAGAIQVEETTDPMYKHAQVDLFLAEAFQGQGLGPEAIRRVVSHLIDERGHHRVVIDPAAENDAAIAAYERVGFRRVGVMRRYERRDGEFRDGLLMELVVQRASGAASRSIVPGGVRLRRATSDDVDVLLPMMRDFNRFEGIPVEDDVLLPALAMLLADASIGAVWLLEGGPDADGEPTIAGYAVATFGFDLEWGGRDAWLTELWVTTEARGEGLGRAALMAVEREVATLGARALHLMVRHENTRARELYRSAGFSAPRRETLTKRIG